MMRFMRWLTFALIALAFAAGVWRETDSGRDAFERGERLVRMGWHQLFHQLGRPIPSTPRADLTQRLAQKGLRLGAPVFLRLFKKEAQLEVWMQNGERFVRLDSYPICYFSGRLGPKQKTGDRQAPEGFYTVSEGQLNPHSRWHRSFDLGFPNLYDRSHGRTGSYLMVHGGCSSIGCYAMTNAVIDDIWALVTAALASGQGRFHVHAYPFRMSDANLRRYRNHPWAPFWQQLKQGSDLFEATGLPPVVSVCGKSYETRPAAAGSRGNAALAQGCSKTAAR